MISSAILSFGGAVIVTLGITAFAASRSASRSDFYTAGARISGLQNGWAITGDFLSAGAFFGLTGLYFTGGVDSAIYYMTPLAGFCLMLLLLAGPLRRLGRFTLADVMTHRLSDPRMRVFSGLSTITISIIYLIAQLVGAGGLISILFGLSFNGAVIIVGILMAIYVAFGGMLAATWVQIVKAVLLVAATVLLTVLCLTESGGLGQLYDRAMAAHPLGAALLEPGGLHMDLFSAASLATGLVLGMAGMPHVLIRLFTVPDEAAARGSIVTASLLVGSVFALLFVIVAPAIVAFVYGAGQFHDASGAIAGGPNMAIMHLTTALGGELLFGVIAAVAFSTILAVVAGLTVAVATAVAHDLYAPVRSKHAVDEGKELRVFRLAAVLTSLLVVCFAIVFQHENIAFLVAMAFSVAASTSFPTLMLTLYWKRTTAVGAMLGGSVGLLSSVALIILGPAVWVKILGHPEPIFPAEYPALVATPLAVVCAVVGSLATGHRSPELSRKAA